MNGIRDQIFMRRSLQVGAVIALYFVVTSVVAIVRSYTPVPHWDMWTGTLGFYLALLDGKTSIWWAQHNEHRIVLTRFLFWLDFKLTDASGWLLLAANPILAALSVYVFYLFSRQLVTIEPARARLVTLLSAAFLTAWLFQWMQEENFAWAFQSQFFMAQLLPLLALYLLARSATAVDQRVLWFAAACVAGVASAGTMANGVICLPLLVVYALLTRQSWQRVLVLVVLSIATLSLYFLNYHSPAHHGSLTQALLTQPVDLAHYVLLYIGTPFYFLAGGGRIAQAVAISASIFMACISVYFLVSATRALMSDTADTKRFWQLALVVYIVYLAGTALGTGGGRLIFGIMQAASQRYTTPALMAWAALFLLLLPGVVRHWSLSRFLLIPALIVLIVIMAKVQWHALSDRQHLVFGRSLAALALELDIMDEPRISSVHPLTGDLLSVVEGARIREISVFGEYPLHGLREQHNRYYRAGRGLPICQGNLDSIYPVAAETDYYYLSGWLINRATRKPASFIRVINNNSVTLGFATGGQVRADVADAVGRHARVSGFGGYMTLPATGGSVRLIADNDACEIRVPVLPEVQENGIE